MRFQISLLLPLACARLYVIGALVVKRAAAFGVGVWRTSFLSNWATGLAARKGSSGAGCSGTGCSARL